jgi:RNA polymerase sigma-70 factor (ECF subfamily)
VLGLGRINTFRYNLHRLVACEVSVAVALLLGVGLPVKPISSTTRHKVAELLEFIHAGNHLAVNDLMEHCADRLRELAHHQMSRFPAVKRWEGSDDLMQQAAIRLLHSLQQVRPATAPQLFALASEMMRRQLIDLYRHYYGPEGMARHHASASGSSPDGASPTVDDPHDLAELTELHEHAGRLPEELRAVFDLRWYQGLSVEQSASVLGVSTPTIKRRWREARIALQERFKGAQ